MSKSSRTCQNCKWCMWSLAAGYCMNPKSPNWHDGDSKVHSGDSCKLFEKGEWKGETAWWLGGHLFDCENCAKSKDGKPCTKEPINCKCETSETRKGWEKKMKKMFKQAEKEGVLCCHCRNAIGMGDGGKFCCLAITRGKEICGVTVTTTTRQRKKKCKFFVKERND